MRHPLVYFHTSNTDKFLQARHLADRAGVNVRQFRAGSEPYDESYELGSQEMLRKALDQIVTSAGKGALVFVEDTSLRIEALSSPEEDFPGLAVKEWFKGTTFDELDARLREAGDRRVVVRSDIALRLPGLDHPVFFHGETVGTVADRPPDFPHNLDYPWLSPHTFNGWFVPDGADLPLGALPVDQADPLDFRAKALRQLLDRVAEYTAVLNLGSAGYRVRDPLPDPAARRDDMLLPWPKILVIGRTCAGKTTFALHASRRADLVMIEASEVVRSLFAEHGPPAGTEPDQPITGELALALLREHGMDRVSQWILDRWGTDLAHGFVVSGLRTIQEIAAFRRAVPDVHIVRVDAPEPMRFARHLAQRRAGREQTIHEFRARDAQQDDFGLLPVAREVADHFIDNVNSLDEYHDDVDRLTNRLAASPGRPDLGPKHTRLSRALQLLVENGPMLLPDIQEQAALGQGNASRVLGNAPQTTLRDKDATGRDRWDISPAGLAYLEVLGHLPKPSRPGAGDSPAGRASG